VGRVEEQKAVAAVDRSIAEQLGLLPVQRFLSATVPQQEEHTNTTMTTEGGENANEC
jgi:hypothetical protein